MTCVYVRAMHAIVEIHMENMAVVCCFYDDRMLVLLLSLSLFGMCVCLCLCHRNSNDAVVLCCAFALFFSSSFCDCSLCLDSLSYSISLSLVLASILTILQCFSSSSSLRCSLLFSSDTHFIHTLFLAVIFVFFSRFCSRFSMLMLLVLLAPIFSLHNLEQSAWRLCVRRVDVLIDFGTLLKLFAQFGARTRTTLLFFLPMTDDHKFSNIFQRLEMGNFHPKAI